MTWKLKKITLDIQFWNKNAFGNVKNELEKNAEKLLCVNS